MMVALYRRNGDLVIDWGRTMPFKYDFFQVRWDLNGRNVGQREIRGRVQGSTVVSRPQDGTYTAVVQGCDSRVLSSTRCRQKWTVPVSIQLPFHRPTVDASDALLVVNQHSKMCVDVAYGSRDQGARIQQYPCHGGPPERWRYDWVTTVNETGYFQIVNQNSGLCLSIRGNAPAVGAQPTQARCNGRVSQMWGNVRAGVNIFRLKPYLDSSLCLDDEGFNTTPGASIQLWKCNGLAVQGWNLKRRRRHDRRLGHAGQGDPGAAASALVTPPMVPPSDRPLRLLMPGYSGNSLPATFTCTLMPS
ncbi:RICIN domain-containing protein [Actinoplanes sp. NPDC051470]|uniref:RICIN domain-containing protein n=1 Tax=Actinoplanes sp. NPDC051470 TaxID=3157224 RepID=UPI00343859FE